MRDPTRPVVLPSAILVAIAQIAAPWVLFAQGPHSDSSRASLPPLHHESVAFDAARGRLVVYDGSDSLDGTWEWDGGRWHAVASAAAGPQPRRFGATMAYDPERRRLVLFGGWSGPPTRPPSFALHCDTWALERGTWARIDDGPCVTDRVRNNSLVYDTRRRALLLLDGVPELSATTVRPMRIWRWSDAGWQLIDSTGPRREGWHRAVYDETRAVVVVPVFEGPDVGVWEWDSRGWRHLRPGTGPIARHAHALAYDPARRAVVLIGGQTFARPSAFRGDAWAWDGARWTELEAAQGVAPGPRSGASLVHDPRSGQLLYFGGYRGPPIEYLAELWLLDGVGWTRAVP